MDGRRYGAGGAAAYAGGGEHGAAAAADGKGRCTECAAKLTSDDIGIYMKMVSRNAEHFLCMTCLAARLGCRREALEERVRYYRESGNCVLFR